MSREATLIIIFKFHIAHYWSVVTVLTVELEAALAPFTDVLHRENYFVM
jgi:hypothetical protein